MDGQSEAPVLVTEDMSVQQLDESSIPFEIVGRVVNFEGMPNFLEVSFIVNPGYEIKPGEILGVYQSASSDAVVTVIQVANCFEINPNESPQLASARDALGLHGGYASENYSTRIFRIAKCQAVEEFVVDATGEPLSSGSPESLARAGNHVVKLTPKLVLASVGALSDPNEGLHVGRIMGPATPEVTLRSLIFQLGIALFGNPGRGKSYAAGVLIEEAHAWDIPLLAIDVNGEMIEAANELGGLVIQLPNATEFGLSLDLLTAPELVHIAPNVNPGTNYAELIEIAHENLKGNRHKKTSFENLKAEIKVIGERLENRKSSIGAAIKRIDALSHNPLIGEDFDFISKLIKHRLVVLDCRYLTLGQTQLIAAAAARVLQKYGKSMSQAANDGDKDASEWLSLLFIDEAHAVAPANDKVVSTQVLYELARMGRHARTGLILSSQSPNDLDPSILKRLQTRFVFALEKDQLRSLTGIHSDLGQEVIDHLPKLQKGVCAVTGTSEVINHGFLMKFRERKTAVGGSTPDVFGARKKNLQTT